MAYAGFTQSMSILLPILYWRRNGSFAEAGKVLRGQLIVAGTRQKPGSTSSGLPNTLPYTAALGLGGLAGALNGGGLLGGGAAGEIGGGAAGALGSGSTAGNLVTYA